ncbi:unnamed protein product [Larinioides sclopetarius]|uniref:Apoptotic chromatin condensation inducer in the nucleus n=2 Tax=Larinioides sclopetarius TaxID=280406 RepID=A0AAV1ZGT2_9ARAC
MEDEASILLDGKTLGNLRVVDLKQELEKRGLSKSGSKKDLVKRLKVQLEFEKLCGERKSAADCDLKLDLDADTEQNEFVQQYLAQQQKIYAEQKEAKRRIELEENLKSTEEKEICDSTKCDEEATIDDDDDQTEPDEPEEEDCRADITSPKAAEDTNLNIVSDELKEDSSKIQEEVNQNTSQPSNVKVESSEGQDLNDKKTCLSSEVKTGSLEVQDDSDHETSQPPMVVAASSEVQDAADQNTSRSLKLKVVSSEIQDDADEETFMLSKEGASGDVDQETSEPLKIKVASPDVVCQETSQASKLDAANPGMQYEADVQETVKTSNAAMFPEEELVEDTAATKKRDCQNQIISSNIVPVDSSIKTAENREVIDNVDNQITSSKITETAHTNSSTEKAESRDTIDHQAEQSSSSQIIQEKEVVFEKSELLPNMEPATQFSTVPYSLMDIQLPESPGNVKSKSTSDAVESDSVNNTEETHSNGIDSTDIKSSKRRGEKSDSKSDSSEKRCSPDKNSSYEKSDELTQQSKESTSDDSKVLESRSQSKKKESDSKSSRYKIHSSDRKTRKSKDDLPAHRDSRSKSAERKRTREDSPCRHSRSRSREKVHKLKEESRSRRDSRSRSKEKERRTRKHERDSDTRKVSRHRDSRSRSKEGNRKTRKSSIDSKSRKVVHSRRKSRSVSDDSKSDHNSDSDDEFQKKKDKAKETKKKRRDQKSRSDSESDKSSSSGSSPSASSKQKVRSSRLEDRHHKRDSSEGTRSSRSRSPIKKKPLKRSDDHSEISLTGKHGRQRSKDNDQSSRSRSRDNSPIQKKSKSRLAEKSDKQKEMSHKAEISDSDKVPKSPSFEDNSSKKKYKNYSNEPQKCPAVESEKIRDHKHRSSEDEDSKSRSRENSPVNIPLKDKSLEQSADSPNLVNKTSKTKRHESSEDSRSQSREKSPEKKIKHKSKSPSDTRKILMSQEESKSQSSKSRSRSRESSPIECKPNEPPSDSVVLSKTSRQEKESESGNSDDNQTSRSRSRESTPVQAMKVSTDESSVDSAALTKHIRQESQSSMDGRDSRSRSREKSPDPKRSKICFDKQGGDSSDISKHQAEASKTAVSESDVPVAVKKGNITIVKKEPVKQKLKIKRDNVIISSQSKREEKEIKSEKLENSETKEENQKEPTSGLIRTGYVSRKITLSSRSQSVASDDEPKSKRSKWGNMASSQKTSTTINISTNSLKNWFPDFKLLKDPTPEEPASLIKEESDMEISVNKPEEDSKQVLNTKRFQEPQREVQMEVDTEETGPVSKILFIQNLVRPFTLNQLKDLLRETGNFIEEDFWIDKIKSKCFVTYETEEEAIKTRSQLNGTRWPSSNPKILSVEFSNEEELTMYRSGNDTPKPLQPLPEPDNTQESRVSHAADEFRKKDHDQDRKRDRSKLQPPVREWDKDKITQESPDRERSGKDVDKSKYIDKKDKKDSKRRTNEDTPAKLLDDLFQKTKSSPCIYWLPLTDEQVQERLEGKRVRRLEREKQNQQREREDAENKSKRPRSRNRTREAENRRSSTRSRSPVTRRR